MAKQVMKGLTMLLLIGVVAFVSAVASANAQSRGELKANVPFDFTVGDKNLPAGEYRVDAMLASGDGIRVRNYNGKAAIRLSIGLVSSAPQKNNKLVFHRYGDRYFLAEVWNAGERNGRKLMTSKAEDAIKRELTAVYRSRGSNENVYERIELLAVVAHD